MIDYRKILKAYMDHVGECEGVFFIGPIREGQIKSLSEGENNALMDIYDELASEPSHSMEEELERQRKYREKVIQERGYW
jgi:hypothetical protein